MNAVDDFWEEHEETLDRLFFGSRSVIKRGSHEHKDFWEFFRRYQAFQKRKGDAKKTRNVSQKNSGKSLDLPEIYNKRYRINFSTLDSDLSRKLNDYKRFGDRRRRDRELDRGELDDGKIDEFRTVLKHFLNFLQRQKFEKLVRIKQAQATLPIRQYRSQILEAIRKNQVVIVAGDTGCGKSTQVPQYLMSAGFKKIACTQPRRIACISLAKRVGHETLNEYGSEIAYQVRFEANKAADTRILFLTEGLLLRQLSSDPCLSGYDVIVVDEVHERHVHTDFLLGVLRHLLTSRGDLKIVLMSATINISLFAGYFQDAPVIQVPGRLYPIQLEYVPIQQTIFSGPSQHSSGPTTSERLDTSQYLRIMQRIDHKYPVSERGDLLVFLSGMKEISALVDEARLYAMHTKRWIVLPLHSALSIEEQDKVFDIAPDGVRKCIVSTNIAETSITIDGVRFIVDSGKVKEMGYDSTSKMRRLQEFWISKASAEQRKGRAGRTGPGVCFRLYSDQDYDAFQDYSTPEIQRVPLDTLILQLMDLDFDDPRSFSFIEPPPLSSINNSILFLKNQSALTREEKLTPIGRMLAKLPVDVVIGKMLVMGSMFDMVDPVLTIAAALSVQSPFHRLLKGGESEVQVRRRELESDHGDALTLMNAFDSWVELKMEGKGSTRRWCKKYGLENQRFYEMAKLKDQFKEILEEYKLLEKEEEDDSDENSSAKRRRDGESTYESRKRRRELRELRRKHRKEPRRRKVLKMEDAEEESEGDEKDELDLKDLEFKLSHDLDKLQAASNFNRSLTLRDINLLKIILCSGLYPQVAVADDCNTWRKDSEQVFHTQAKPFVVLHPTSVFANQPDVLQSKMGVEEGMTATGHRDKLRFSTKHEFLAYVDLLETTKPFLVSNLRVPALQTLLLFAQNLDTNEDCRRIVVDGWLELVVPEAQVGQKLIAAAQQLRSTWNRLLELRLQRVEGLKGGVELYHAMHHASGLEKTLARKLSEFLDSQISYSFRRLAAAELERLYVGPKDSKGTADSGSSCTSHPTKGGQIVTDYLTYNCLSSAIFESDYGGALMKHWNCPRCGKSMVVTIAEKLRHEDECRQQEDKDTLEKKIKEGGGAALSASSQRVAEGLRKDFLCDKCKKTFSFTVTEVLKHVRGHQRE
ncbi:probable ATP-dependent RNA helicase DHX34 [Oscarella lobularis]|uniref:probable ATP-dependent RNA helicase DHX34 n=1 Tax=Oscarella lobularis TaxID=121494 RepID=UPI003313834A